MVMSCALTILLYKKYFKNNMCTTYDHFLISIKINRIEKEGLILDNY